MKIHPRAGVLDISHGHTITVWDNMYVTGTYLSLHNPLPPLSLHVCLSVSGMWMSVCTCARVCICVCAYASVCLGVCVVCTRILSRCWFGSSQFCQQHGRHDNRIFYWWQLHSFPLYIYWEFGGGRPRQMILVHA
jgi:hypothetical protein